LQGIRTQWVKNLKPVSPFTTLQNLARPWSFIKLVKMSCLWNGQIFLFFLSQYFYDLFEHNNRKHDPWRFYKNLTMFIKKWCETVKMICKICRLSFVAKTGKVILSSTNCINDRFGRVSMTPGHTSWFEFMNETEFDLFHSSVIE